VPHFTEEEDSDDEDGAARPGPAKESPSSSPGPKLRKLAAGDDVYVNKEFSDEDD
jgi:hypothetical protein